MNNFQGRYAIRHPWVGPIDCENPQRGRWGGPWHDLGLGWQALDPFPGYTGRPHRATREAGAVFAAHILDEYEQLVDDVFFGNARSPAPIMAWVAALTANGRLSPSAP